MSTGIGLTQPVGSQKLEVSCPKTLGASLDKPVGPAATPGPVESAGHPEATGRSPRSFSLGSASFGPRNPERTHLGPPDVRGENQLVPTCFSAFGLF